MYLAIDTVGPASFCKAAFWERIDGWEVVIAVLIIIAGWSIVQTGRMYFMWRVAAIGAGRGGQNDSKSPEG